MKTRAISLLLLPVVCVASAFAAPIINTTSLGTPVLTPFGYEGDTPGNTIDDDQDGIVDEPDFIERRHSVGQTFELLPGFPLLEGITIRTQDTQLFGDSRDRDATFTMVVMEWDEAAARPMGEVLFESDAVTPVQNGEVEEHVIPTGSLLLEPGVTYVAFVMLEEPEPSSGNHSLCRILSRDGNPYAGGNLVTKTGGTLGLEGVGAEAWSVQATQDLSMVVEAAELPVGFATDSASGDLMEIRFGTSGDIPDNTIDDDQDGAVDEGFVSPLHQHTIGQTFLVPAGIDTLEEVVFAFRDSALVLGNPQHDKIARFVLSIAEWDAVAKQPTGVVLFESDLTEIPQTGVEVALGFDGLAVPVTAGKMYIAYVTMEDLGLASGNHSLCFLRARSDDPYPVGGIFRVGDDARDPESLTAGPWVEVAADVVGAITFSEADPDADSNGDGVPDAWVASYGLDPAHDYSGLANAIRAAQVAAVQASPEEFDLYDEDSIADLRFGGVLFEKTGAGVSLSFEIETSHDLDDWEVFETIERDVPLVTDKAFLRVRVAPEGE